MRETFFIFIIGNLINLCAEGFRVFGHRQKTGQRIQKFGYTSIPERRPEETGKHTAGFNQFRKDGFIYGSAFKIRGKKGHA